jgi:hypothetical protein
VKVFHLRRMNRPGACGALSSTSEISFRCGQAAGDRVILDFLPLLPRSCPFVLPSLRFPIQGQRNGLAIGQLKSPDKIMKKLMQNPPGITRFAIYDATNYARVSDIASSRPARR